MYEQLVEVLKRNGQENHSGMRRKPEGKGEFFFRVKEKVIVLPVDFAAVMWSELKDSTPVDTKKEMNDRFPDQAQLLGRLIVEILSRCKRLFALPEECLNFSFGGIFFGNGLGLGELH